VLFGILVGEELDRRDEAAIADMDVVALVVVEEGVGQGRTPNSQEKCTVGPGFWSELNDLIGGFQTTTVQHGKFRGDTRTRFPGPTIPATGVPEGCGRIETPLSSLPNHD